MATVTLNGHTYSDDANPSTGMANGGHRTRLIPMMQDVVAVAAEVEADRSAAAGEAADAATQASIAAGHAADAANKAMEAAAAASSVMSNPATSGTSTTSVTIGAGSKTLVTQAGKSFYPGMTLKVFFDPSNYMVGTCTAYDSVTGSMTVSVGEGGCVGTGTYSAWTIGVAVYDGSTDALIYSMLFSL